MFYQCEQNFQHKEQHAVMLQAFAENGDFYHVQLMEKPHKKDITQ
jgi:hypothetical protein